MKRLLMIAVTIMMSSCYTSNKANKDINKAYENYPETVAAFARDKFPCKETDVDSIVKTEYDFIEIKCPDQAEPVQVIDTLYLTKPSRPKTFILYKDKFVAIPTTTKIITKIVGDSSCEILLKKSVEDQQNYIRKNEKQADWIKWLLILLSISIIGNILFAFNKR
jgi:hypothetical protein